MIVTDLVRSVLILGLLFADQFFWIIFVVNILLSLSSIFFTPARQAIVPTIVTKDELPAANALLSTVWGTMAILGASLGGIITAFVSPNIAFILNSLSFFLSALFISSADLPIIKMEISNKRFFVDMKEGYKFVLKTRVILALILVGASWGIVGGAYQILLTIYGSHVFNAGQTGIGTLYAVQGVGIIIGGWIVTKLVGSDDYKTKWFFGWSYLLQGVFFIFFTMSTNIYLGSFFLLLMRIAGGIIIPIDTTLIQKHTPENMIGKVFALHSSVYTSIMQFSMFLTGVLLDFITPTIVGALFGAFCVLVSLTWLIMLYTDKLDNDAINFGDSKQSEI